MCIFFHQDRMSLRGSKGQICHNIKVKFQTTNGANILALGKQSKVSMVTSSSKLRLRGQRSKQVKFQTKSNVKTNGANMLALCKHSKVSMVTSSSYLRLRGQRSKKSNFKQCQMVKLKVCRSSDGCVPVT